MLLNHPNLATQSYMYATYLANDQKMSLLKNNLYFFCPVQLQPIYPLYQKNHQFFQVQH